MTESPNALYIRKGTTEVWRADYLTTCEGKPLCMRLTRLSDDYYAELTPLSWFRDGNKYAASYHMKAHKVIIWKKAADQPADPLTGRVFATGRYLEGLAQWRRVGT